MTRNLSLIAVCLFWGSFAHAGFIAEVFKTTNDGVYTITPTQAAALGAPTATHVGLLRLRQGSGLDWSVGDTFDATTVQMSTLGGSASALLGIFNGRSPDVGYTGTTLWDPLGTSTVLIDDVELRETVMFAFNTDGNIVFNGTTTFNKGQSRGAADFLVKASVPEPGTFALLLMGLAGMAMRKRI